MLTVAPNKIMKLVPSDPRTIFSPSFTYRIAVNIMTSIGTKRKEPIPETNCAKGGSWNEKPSVIMEKIRARR
jgi:hypothetical protein